MNNKNKKNYLLTITIFGIFSHDKVGFQNKWQMDSKFNLVAWRQVTKRDYLCQQGVDGRHTLLEAPGVLQ